MSPREQLVYGLWFIQPILESVVLIAMFRRKVYRTSPFFFSYIASQIATFCILFPIYRANWCQAYFYAFWITSAVSVALGFKVIHEVFLDIFHPYHTLKDLGAVLFKWSALVMLLVAGVISASSQAGADGPLAHAVVTLQRSMRVVQCGLVCFLIVFSKYLGISWRQRSFGIAIGFGSFATVDLGVLALNAGGYLSRENMNVVNMAAYGCAIIVWLVYAVMASVSRESSVTLLKSQRWEQGLADIQCPVPADSLIPMFEGMVERALSRSSYCSTVVHAPVAQQLSPQLHSSAPSEYFSAVASKI